MISLADLSERNLEVLQILRELKIANRLEISRKSRKLHVDKVSGALNRLEAFGLVEKPNGWRNREWQMTEAGRKLFGDAPPVLHEQPSAQVDDDFSENDNAVTSGEYLSTMQDLAGESPDGPQSDPIPSYDKAFMEQMELNEALDSVVARLRMPVPPASSRRVYLRLIEALPEPIRQALEPITAMVKVYG